MKIVNKDQDGYVYVETVNVDPKGRGLNRIVKRMTKEEYERLKEENELA